MAEQVYELKIRREEEKYFRNSEDVDIRAFLWQFFILFFPRKREHGSFSFLSPAALFSFTFQNFCYYGVTHLMCSVNIV